MAIRMTFYQKSGRNNTRKDQKKQFQIKKQSDLSCINILTKLLVSLIKNQQKQALSYYFCDLTRKSKHFYLVILLSLFMLLRLKMERLCL